MCEDAADVLREAVDDQRTVSDTWDDQQSVNDSITVSPSDTVERNSAEDSRADELTAAIAEVVKRRSERSDV